MTTYSHYPLKSQLRAFYKAHDNIAGGNETMLDLLFGPNPITDDELRRLTEKRPGTYGRFAGYIGKRNVPG
jgi:hypothetical protein